MFHPLNSSKQTFESHLRIKTYVLDERCPWELPALSTWSGGISRNNERCNLSIVKNLNSELPYLGAIRCFTCESELDNWECNTKSPDVFCQPGNGISSFSRFDHFFLNCREHFLSSLKLIEKFWRRGVLFYTSRVRNQHNRLPTCDEKLQESTGMSEWRARLRDGLVDGNDGKCSILSIEPLL